MSHERLSDDDLLRILNEELAKIVQNNICTSCEEGHEDPRGPGHAIVNLYLAERAQVVAMCAAALAKTPFPDIKTGPVAHEIKARGLWDCGGGCQEG